MTSINISLEKCLNTLDQLNQGIIRVAEPLPSGSWQHNPEVQAAVLAYFRHHQIDIRPQPWPHRDVVPAKFPDTASLAQAQQRIVPPAYIRYGAFLAKQVVAMPCFVNIGAYVDEATMLDTWCTIGSCAQIGKRVHISGGVGIGGVLEPATAMPTIIEDDCFIGARCEIAEGVHIKKGAVIATGTNLTQSTKIFDRLSGQISYGVIPESAVVVPGTLPSSCGTCQLQAAIIVKYADEQTRGKTALNEFLRLEKNAIYPPLTPRSCHPN